MQGHSETIQELFYVCMYIHARIIEDRGVQDSLTLRAMIMSLHKLLLSHPHPSVTHREQIRWTASITWHYTLVLQAFFRGNKIWSTLFDSTVCICMCFCQFGKGWVSTEHRYAHSRDCARVTGGCTKVRSLTREKWLAFQAPAVGKAPLQFTTWHNQHHIQSRSQIQAKERTLDTQGQHFPSSTIYLNKNIEWATAEGSF